MKKTLTPKKRKILRSLRTFNYSRTDLRSETARQQNFRVPDGVPFQTKEWETWLLRSGISPDSGMPISRIGIYTDFT